MAEEETTPAIVEEKAELFFGIKATEEVEIDGVVGLVTRGWASKYSVIDQEGDYQAPGSFRDVDDTWGRQAKPLVLYNHGMDPILVNAPIGYGLKYGHTDEGLYAECFIPRDPQPPFKDNAAAKNKRYRDIYNGIKSRRIAGYSVGGLFKRAGKALIHWSMLELTITPTPCLANASFVIGQKAISDYMVQIGSAATDATPGPYGALDMPAWSSVMGHAQKHMDHKLHNHLLDQYPTHEQGDHSASDCPVCAVQRGEGMGGKSADPEPVIEPAESGAKAVTVCDVCGKEVCTCVEVPSEATDIITSYIQGVKAGRRFSRKSKASITDVITKLQGLIEEIQTEETGE